MAGPLKNSLLLTLALLVVTHLTSVIIGQPVDPVKEEIGKVEKLIRSEENTFKEHLKVILYDAQESADELIKSGRVLNKSKGFAMKKISYYSSMIECIVFAARKKVLLATKNILENVSHDDQAQDSEAPLLAQVLVKRALLRATLDGLFYTSYPWNQLRLLIEEHQDTKTLHDPVSILGVKTANMRQELEYFNRATNLEQENLLENYKDKLDSLLKNDYPEPYKWDINSFSEDIDSILEEEMKSSKCAQGKAYSLNYPVKCIFDNSAEIEKAVKELVDPDILVKLSYIESDYVRDMSLGKVQDLVPVHDFYEEYPDYSSNTRDIVPSLY